MSEFNNRITELMKTDNINKACSGWIKISETKRNIDSICICGRKIKHIYYLYNERLNEIANIGSSCVKKLLVFNLRSINLDKTISKLLCINYNDFVNKFEQLTLDEYRELVFSSFCELIDNTYSIKKLENIQEQLTHNKNEISIIINERIDILISNINEKINKINIKSEEIRKQRIEQEEEIRNKE